ncbi:glycerophosphodiester phosphodiesterase [Microbulbifer sp. OS29]|uniref:glycerophosphodiester phosphodiesterase n=1 Tax=Microbulbifer okhotskensis TaxID=2926617 RepID=A0A9X2EJ58_9GAMM|nr:glycerophosphodiester phosphodiesterase [Microbulbifer okhotskensis]MCO1333229.1 glycerophosphodiester phosphodiesterase [Microbulbifer okhotskensis]
MFKKLLSFVLIGCSIASTLTCADSIQPRKKHPLVVAHRGASAYLPEHTLESKALAYGMRPDYIEQDLVLSKDNHLIVMHDIHLDNVTNVAEVFPQRARDDGHFYTIDFSLTELKQLRVSEPFINGEDGHQAKYPGRFPLWKSSFKLSTFEEELELIQGLNRSLGYDIGIYPEIKKPYFHHWEGRDIAVLALQTLKKYSYSDIDQKIFLQCFDAEELQRIKFELMPSLGMDLPLVQLVAATDWGEKLITVNGNIESYDYDWMLQQGGLSKIATYAEGIGPWYPMLIDTKNGKPSANGVVRRAHSRQLQVHPYTFRADTGKVPEEFASFEDFLHFAVYRLRIDALFTDHPDRAVNYLSRNPRHNPTN